MWICIHIGQKKHLHELWKSKVKDQLYCLYSENHAGRLPLGQLMVSLVCWSCWLEATPRPTPPPVPNTSPPSASLNPGPSMCAALWWKTPGSAAGHPHMALKLEVRKHDMASIWSLWVLVILMGSNVQLSSSTSSFSSWLLVYLTYGDQCWVQHWTQKQ